MQVALERIVARPRHAIVRRCRHPIIRRRRHAILRYSLVARHGRKNCSEILTSKPSLETSKPSMETSKPSMESTKRKTAESARLRNSARLRICALRGGNCGENGGSEKHRADFDQATRYAHSPLPISPRTTSATA